MPRPRKSPYTISATAANEIISKMENLNGLLESNTDEDRAMIIEAVDKAMDKLRELADTADEREATWP